MRRVEHKKASTSDYVCYSYCGKDWIVIWGE